MTRETRISSLWCSRTRDLVANGLVGIKWRISTASFSVILNDSPVGYFKFKGVKARGSLIPLPVCPRNGSLLPLD